MNIAAKYGKSYFMPPEVTYDWVKKDSIEKPPVWCSVDLRDGNQALIEPMGLEEKLEFFRMLVDIGFKEIEVGFPAASDTEYNFMRALIERDMIPKDVTVQVLTQAREHIIRKTFEAVKGAPHAVIHLYNSTSVAQREQVFKKSREEVKKLAVDGAELLKTLAAETDGNFTFEYSPESFPGTEVDYAVEVCNAVLDVWKPDAEHKAIINIPTTVQIAMPHVFACQIEYIHKHLKYRDNVVLSVHPHNDRGCGISDAEFGILAGADRVEGTLFGNGERTGNVDIVTLAMNMVCHGVDPKLDFSNISEIREKYERFTGMRVYERTPYAGDLVFTAFSGSHQDAISKGMAWREAGKSGERWDVPYLPLDPKDVGREYESDVIRINSQSGKGGTAFIMAQNFGFDLPKAMHPEFGAIVQAESDHIGHELQPAHILDLFKREYLQLNGPYRLTKRNFQESHQDEESQVTFSGTLECDGNSFNISGDGNGPIDAFFNAIHGLEMDRYAFVDYKEHAINTGSDSQAVAYIHLRTPDNQDVFGVGMDHNISMASIKGVLSAINRAKTLEQKKQA